MAMRVIVLGGSGMLGSMLVDYLSLQQGLQLSATVRNLSVAQIWRQRLPSVEWSALDALSDNLGEALEVLRGHAWAINAIGITKPRVHDDNPAEVELAIRTNSLFPHALAKYAEAQGVQVIQIATDCAYSGSKGNYSEGDPHDPLDVYGKTKSLGEVRSQALHHLRCSIIGPEPREHKFLLDWFLGRGRGEEVKGFRDHRWNGLTTLHFAKIVHGILVYSVKLADLQHCIPSGHVSKYELLCCLGRSYRRGDIRINEQDSVKAVDRTLSTQNPSLNAQLWRCAGYSRAPSVAQMVAELAEHKYRMAVS